MLKFPSNIETDQFFVWIIALPHCASQVKFSLKSQLRHPQRVLNINDLIDFARPGITSLL